MSAALPPRIRSLPAPPATWSAPGLNDVAVGGPEFAAGHSRALQIATAIVVAATLIAAVTLRGSGAGPMPAGEPPRLPV